MGGWMDGWTSRPSARSLRRWCDRSGLSPCVWLPSEGVVLIPTMLRGLNGFQAFKALRCNYGSGEKKNKKKQLEIQLHL